MSEKLEEISASNRYFSARPQIDSDDRRRVFEAGFKAAWIHIYNKLAESQAREAKMRDDLMWILVHSGSNEMVAARAKVALAYSQDRTALDEAIRKGKIEMLMQLQFNIQWEFLNDDDFKKVVLVIREMIAQAEQNRNDAERYRWLREHHSNAVGKPFICIHSPGGFAQWIEAEADFEVDAAIAQEKKLNEDR